MSSPEEIPLTGGNTNTVVRVGNTVRRQTNKHSPTHHRLLHHLAAQGFDRAPNVLGHDDQGREILSYIGGDTAFPPDLWTNDAPLIAAAKMLRDFHAASATFDTTNTSWAVTNTPTEVICHNDFAPYNMVFRHGLPAAIIDFDVCGPGPRLRDLAYLAYWMVPLSFAADDLAPLTEQQAHQGYPRLRLLCDTYGTTDTCGLLTWMSKALRELASFAEMERVFDRATAEKLQAEGHLSHWTAEAQAFDRALPELRARVRQP